MQRDESEVGMYPEGLLSFSLYIFNIFSRVLPIYSTATECSLIPSLLLPLEVTFSIILIVYVFVLGLAEIVEQVKNGQLQKPVLRPNVDDDQADEEVVQMMKRCWVEDPNERPDFPVLKATIRRLNKYIMTTSL